MNPKASIIMPAYNATRWIGQAVESVLRQKEPDWELLIIDDGSHDGSRELATALAAKDPRIRVLRNARGKGPGGARNTGLEKARGQAVMFLDSDDVLFPDAVGSLYRTFIRLGLPVVRGGELIFCHKRWLTGLTYASYKAMPQAGATDEHDQPSPPDASIARRDKYFPPAAFCCHIYDRAFLERHSIDFPAYSLGEDRVFICHAYLHAGSIPVVDIPVSIYRINHKPIRHSAVRSNSFVAYNRSIRALLSEHGREDMVAPYIEEVFLPEWLSHLHSMLSEGDDAALGFTEHCRLLLSGQEELLAKPLRHNLGQAADELLSLVRQGDSAGMLVLLKRHIAAHPPAPYIGIPAGAGGLGYFLARRAANLLRGPMPARVMLRLAGLRLGHVWRILNTANAGDPL